MFRLGIFPDLVHNNYQEVPREAIFLLPIRNPRINLDSFRSNINLHDHWPIGSMGELYQSLTSQH